MEAALLEPAPGAALPLEHVHRHGPALPELADHPLLGDEGAVEEDLREVVLAVLGADRPHLDAVLVEVDQHHRQAPVPGPAGAGEQHRPAREVPERRPHLLAVQPVAVAVGLHAGAQRRQVAAGVGLGEGLGPGVVAAQQTREQLVGEVGGEHEQHRHQDLERGERLGDLDVEVPQRLEHRRPEPRIAAEPAGALGPPEARPALVEEQRLEPGEVGGGVLQVGGAVADVRLGPRIVAQELGQRGGVGGGGVEGVRGEGRGRCGHRAICSGVRCSSRRSPA